MNFLKTYIILLIINILPLIANAGSDEDYSGRDQFHYLFDPSLVLGPESDYLVYYTKYHGYNMQDERNWTDNLESWVVFFEDKYKLSDLKSTIYRDKPFITFLIELQNLREKKQTNINIDNKEESFIGYLRLALDVEHLLYDNYNSWDYYNNVDTTKINNLVSILQLSIKHEKFNFIKERYAYQLIKLLRYNKKYLEASEVYKNHFSYTAGRSVISYWAMDQYAGVLRKLGDTTSSNYYFLKVIINSPSKRISAFSSYNVRSQKEFDMLEKMCRSNEEKIFLFFMRANNRKSLILYEMDNIKNITVNDSNDIILNDNIMKVLMTRQLNQINPYIPRTLKFKEYLEDLISFNKQMISMTKGVAFWELSLSYLLYLNNQNIDSESILNSINNLTEGQELQRYIIKNLNYLKSKDRFNYNEEEYLGSLLFNISSNINSYNDYDYSATSEFISLLKNEISKKSTKQFYKDVFDHSGKGLNPVNYLYYSDLNIINQHLLNINNTKNSVLKEYVLQNNYKNIILERKGTLLMRNPDSLEQAINIFEILPDHFINNYPRFSVNHNPFIANIKDCIGLWNDCPGNPIDSRWNKLTLSKKLLNIRTRAYRDNSPQDYFLLATAYYNMSYFGSSWNALSHYRTSTKVHGFYDMEIPLGLYNNAITLSNDDELIAESLFMTAKCERNIFFIENYDNYYWYPKEYRAEIIRAGYRKNFYKLQKYKHTTFFNQAFNECSDFSYYSNRY